MDGKRIADELDPAQYIAHVTRTALLLEQQAESVLELRRQSQSTANEVYALRTDVGNLRTEIAVLKERLGGLATATSVKGTLITAVTALLAAMGGLVWFALK